MAGGIFSAAGGSCRSSTGASGGIVSTARPASPPSARCRGANSSGSSPRPTAARATASSRTNAPAPMAALIWTCARTAPVTSSENAGPQAATPPAAADSQPPAEPENCPRCGGPLVRRTSRDRPTAPDRWWEAAPSKKDIVCVRRPVRHAPYRGRRRPRRPRAGSNRLPPGCRSPSGYRRRGSRHGPGRRAGRRAGRTAGA